MPNYSATIGGKELSLTKREFETLAYLAQNSGKVVRRDRLLAVVWGHDVQVIDRTIDVHISKIREKLGAYGDYIETVKGVGYRLKV